MGKNSDNIRIKLLKLNLNVVQKLYQDAFSDLLEETMNMSIIIDGINNSTETSENLSKMDNTDVKKIMQMYGVYRNHIIELICVLKRIRLCQTVNKNKFNSKTLEKLLEIIGKEKNLFITELNNFAINFNNITIDMNIYDIIKEYKKQKDLYADKILEIFNILTKEYVKKIKLEFYLPENDLETRLKENKFLILKKIMDRCKRYLVDYIKNDLINYSTDLPDLLCVHNLLKE